MWTIVSVMGSGEEVVGSARHTDAKRRTAQKKHREREVAVRFARGLA